jgi:hypothetical protein
MVPAAIKLLRSCGILGVLGLVAVWLGNGILVGRVSGFEWRDVDRIYGRRPGDRPKKPCASMVVPCGMDAMRTTISPKFGTLVAGT